MRLSEISSIINTNLPYIHSSILKAKGTTPGVVQLHNLADFREAVENFELTGLFEEELEIIKDLSFFKNSFETFSISADEYNKLLALTNKIYEAANALEVAIDATLPEQNDKVVNIKLPPNATTLGEISKFFRDLEIAFIPLVEDGSYASVEGFEPGSKWINIVVGSSLAVKLLADLSWAGAVVAKKTQEYRIQEQEISTMEFEGDTREAVLKGLQLAQSKKVSELTKAEAGAICERTGKKYTLEQIRHLEESIQKFSELILKGTEVHPSLMAPEEVENLFPKDTPYNLLESRTKLLDQTAGPSSN